MRWRRSGVDLTWWWRSRPWFLFLKVLTIVLALGFVAWLARALVTLIVGRPVAGPWNFSPDTHCSKIGISCGAVTGWVTSLLSIALATTVFLLVRMLWVRWRYMHAARHHARAIVPTAGTIIGRIVGRDQLCRVIMEDLRIRRTRRPHVLVGGVGTGKTAVLVQLTRMLAQHHAVPVPLRLRDARSLDFGKLAKERFLSQISDRLSSEAEGERAWRRLVRDGRIVVLADGLEEALAGDTNCAPEGDVGERDTIVRNAIRDARQRHLPLLIASRPHTPLRGMDATIHELEPLSETNALRYVREETPTEDDWRLSWIVEMAGVAEAPLYLQITRELNNLDMLDRIVTREAQVLQAPTYDRSTLRLRLLQTWEEALLRGRLYPEVALDRAQRMAALDWMSALACIGLRNDSLQVRLDEPIAPRVKAEINRRARQAALLDSRRAAQDERDLPLAAEWATRLRLVEPGANLVRFQHSLIESYLGSRLMDVALTEDYWRDALTGDRAAPPAANGQRQGPPRPRPGREFLIALVLHSRYGPVEPVPAGAEKPPRRYAASNVLVHLTKATNTKPGPPGNKILDTYAAALEIAGAPDQPAPRPAKVPADVGGPTTRTGGHGRQGTNHQTGAEPGRPAGPGHPDGGAAQHQDFTPLGLGKTIACEWDRIRSADSRTLDEAKLGLVCRFSDALTTLNAPARELNDLHGGYQPLFDICCRENSYRVRLAGAQEIGLGGCAACKDLIRQTLVVPCDESWIPSPPKSGSAHGRNTPNPGRWARQVSAWVLPLLLTTTNPDGDDPRYEELRRQARERLRKWVRHTAGSGCGQCRGEQRLSIPEEIALAQGFKHAANQRHRRLHTRPEAWMFLEQQALEMLKHARYWFSELTLLQALTLWALSASRSTGPAATAEENGDTGIPGQPRRHPDETVERWLDIIAGKPSDVAGQRGRKARPIHPFVEAAADLCSRALAVEEPGRFLWMDESDVVSRVGAGQPRKQPTRARTPRLWIQPSMGWSALDPEAQQLVGDVLLLLNLAERGDEPGQDLEARLEAASKHELPPCIRQDRRPLEPSHTVSTAGSHQPGDSCLDGCRFQLCPYPPKGLQHYRAELSEEFCRRQYRLARRYLKIGRHTARWQGMWGRRLRAFWSQMADRARGNAAGP